MDAKCARHANRNVWNATSSKSATRKTKLFSQLVRTSPAITSRAQVKTRAFHTSKGLAPRAFQSCLSEIRCRAERRPPAQILKLVFLSQPTRCYPQLFPERIFRRVHV